MTREDLEENPIACYLFFGKSKFRVRYTGQKTTCGYCAEQYNLERNCTKKQNMIIMVQISKLEKRMAKNPSEIETKPFNLPPTQEEAKQPFEEQPQRINENERKKLNKNQQPTTLTNRDSGKRPLSDWSNSPTMEHRNKRKNSKGERDDSSSSRRDPEISSGTSDDDEVSEFQLFADPCCHELIQKCTG